LTPPERAVGWGWAGGDASPGKGQAMRKKVLRIKQSVVRVAAKTTEGTEVGTGFVVAAGPYHGYAITCRHCIEGCQPCDISVTFSDGKEWPVSQVRPHSSTDKDVALLSLHNPLEEDQRWGAEQDVRYPPLELGSWTEVDEGEEVLFCGYPMRVRSAFTQRAMVSSKTMTGPRGEQVRCIWLDGSINAGNSGGPLTSIESERVVGVVSTRIGGLSEKLMESIRFMKKFRGVAIGLKQAGETVDPFKVMAESLETLHNLASIGIGAAIEIDAAKELLYEVSE